MAAGSRVPMCRKYPELQSCCCWHTALPGSNAGKASTAGLSPQTAAAPHQGVHHTVRQQQQLYTGRAAITTPTTAPDSSAAHNNKNNSAHQRVHHAVRQRVLLVQQHAQEEGVGAAVWHLCRGVNGIENAGQQPVEWRAAGKQQALVAKCWLEQCFETQPLPCPARPATHLRCAAWRPPSAAPGWRCA